MTTLLKEYIKTLTESTTQPASEADFAKLQALYQAFVDALGVYNVSGGGIEDGEYLIDELTDGIRDKALAKYPTNAKPIGRDKAKRDVLAAAKAADDFWEKLNLTDDEKDELAGQHNGLGEEQFDSIYRFAELVNGD